MARKCNGGPRVDRGYVDQFGRGWLVIKHGQHEATIAIEDLVSAESEVFKQLARSGINLITHAAKASLREEAQNFSGFKKRRVADRPGWYRPHYVLADGSIISPKQKTKGMRPLVTFSPNPKCRSSSDLDGFLEAVGPFVRKQPLLLFAIAYSLAPVLMDVVASTRSRVDNSGVELVSPTSFGKTRVLGLAGAVWGGDPEKIAARGYAETWNLTVEGVERLMPTANDGFLGLDEATLAGKDDRSRAEKVAETIMRLADGGGKVRYTDLKTMPPVRLFYISTSNKSLLDCLEQHHDVISAHAVRLVTVVIPADRRYGVFDRLPSGYGDSRSAADALTVAYLKKYGSLGRAFIERLVRERANDKKALVARIQKLVFDFEKAAGIKVNKGFEGRRVRPFALAYAAGRLAKEWELIPSHWGSLRLAILKVYGMTQAPTQSQSGTLSTKTAEDRIRAYLDQYRSNVIRVGKRRLKLSSQEFDACPGFIHRNRNGQLELLVPPRQMQVSFPDYQSMVRSLRKSGLAATEGGTQPKLTVKRHIRRNAPPDRVYAFQLPSDCFKASQ